jgi:hypothetical protein
VRARIGPDDAGLWESPRRELLREISTVEPEPSGIHVLLDEHLGVRSTQRLALADVAGGVVVGLWPAELKAQAEYLYVDGRGVAMVRAAGKHGWDVQPNLHIAFFTAPPSQRLYLSSEVDPEEYAERWEGSDGRQIGQHSSAELRQQLWRWLKQRGYASDEDEDVLEQFLSLLGRRPAHLRPGMRFRRRWDLSETDRLDSKDLARAIRIDVNAILRAADDPPLPASSSV